MDERLRMVIGRVKATFEDDPELGWEGVQAAAVKAGAKDDREADLIADVVENIVSRDFNGWHLPYASTEVRVLTEDFRDGESRR